MKAMAFSSSERHCLFCWNLTPPSPGDKVAGSSLCLEVAGAGHSDLLRRQLSQWFILRKLLDIPISWCENVLMTSDGEEGKEFWRGNGEEESVGSGLKSWFAVCANCHNQFVEEAWRVHEQILRLEGRMREIKTEIKKKIKEYCGGRGKRGRGSQSSGGEEKIAMKIRGLAVPEIEEMLQNSTVKVRLSTCDLDDELGDSNSELGDFVNEQDADWQPDADNDIKMDIKLESKTATSDSDEASSYYSTSEVASKTGKIRRNPTSKSTSSASQGYQKKKAFPCTLCECIPFTTSADLQDHLQLHKERQLPKDTVGDSNEKNLNCPQCTYPARDALELNTHILRRHRVAKWKNKHRYQCLLCSKSLRDWHKLQIHLKTVHKSAPKDDLIALQNKYLKCSECDFLGTLPRDLALHQKQAHGDLQPPVPVDQGIPCPTCQVLFASDKDLQTHLHNVHLRPSRFMCDLCGRGFSYPAALSDHRISHTKDTKRDWVCDVCGVDFPRGYELKKHHRDYHSEETSSDRVYNCRYCDLTSPYNAVIRKHLQTHKEQGKHRCEKCGKFYMNAQGLKRHDRINHPKGGEGTVPCPHCKKTFPSREYMVVHQKRYCKLKSLAGSSSDTQDN